MGEKVASKATKMAAERAKLSFDAFVEDIEGGVLLEKMFENDAG